MDAFQVRHTHTHTYNLYFTACHAAANANHQRNAKMFNTFSPSAGAQFIFGIVHSTHSLQIDGHVLATKEGASSYIKIHQT